MCAKHFTACIQENKIELLLVLPPGVETLGLMLVVPSHCSHFIKSFNTGIMGILLK